MVFIPSPAIKPFQALDSNTEDFFSKQGKEIFMTAERIFFRFALPCFCAFAMKAWAQREDNTIVLNVTQAQVSATYLNGFHAALSGQTLAYHSSHPDAETALIARARREASTIVWRTDTLTLPVRGDFYHLVWLAGLEHAGWGNTKAGHKFELFINERHWFTFENRKDATARNWKISGEHGGELSFEALLADKFDDLFGHMFLKLPVAAFPPGAPLRLKVVAEEAENMEWYMTFQHRFDFTPRLRLEPALMKTQNRVAQTLRLSLDNLQNNRSLMLRSPHQAELQQPLKLGANIFMLPIPMLQTETDIEVLFKINDKLVRRETVKIKPATRREIFLLPFTHNDIGYTDLQPNVERAQWRHLEEALRLIHATRDYPAEARHKWNIEILWPLESYLQQASEEKREEALAAIRSGSLGLNALYVNPLTGLANAVEMNHFTDYARRLTREHSISITTAQVSDIPGFTWGIVTALAQSGVKYFASAPNSGDRVGHVYEWGDKPFYWRSQSGAEKILFWLANASYASFHQGTLTHFGDEKILKLMRKLEAEHYPYEIVHLPYTLGDNGGPDARLSDFVRSWNERYDSPRLRIATQAEMFETFEARYGASLPLVQGDFTPYWEDGAASSAFETALSRSASSRLAQAEALWAMRDSKNFPEKEFYAAWRNIVLYDEHTWGAHNSVSEPDLPFVTEQWRIKQRFALEADSLSRALLAQAAHTTSARESAIEVYNTSSWTRTELVLLANAQSRAGDLAVDEKGKAVPSQRLFTGELAVLVESLAPLSAKRFFIKKGKAQQRGAAKAAATTLENELIFLSVDEHTGAINNLRWKKSGVEFVNGATGLGLNQYLYVAGKNPEHAQRLQNVTVKIKESGNLVAALLIEAQAPGCKRFASEIRLVAGWDRIDIINTFDKKAVREKEGVHIAFAFHVPSGELRYDVANAIVRPEQEQLTGACKNFFSVQSWVDVSNRETGLTWAAIDAPLIEIGAITAESPWMKSIAPSTTIYSYVMNNYWHTNYKAEQEGPVQFRYALIPHGEFKPEEAARFGREARAPLLVTRADMTQPPPVSLLRLASPEVLVESITPIAEGRAWLLYLYNPTGREQEVALEWNNAAAVSMHTSDSFGNVGALLAGKLRMRAYGSLFVRVEKRF